MRYTRFMMAAFGLGALISVPTCSIDMAGIGSSDAGRASNGGAMGARGGSGGGSVAGTGGAFGTGGVEVAGTGGDILETGGTIGSGGRTMATGGTGTGGILGTGGLDAGVPGTGGAGTGGAVGGAGAGGAGRAGSGGNATGGRGGSATGGVGAGAGGTATGGRIGTGGAASGGRMGTGGVAGHGGNGGAGGGGANGAKPECTKASDCRLQSDCCNCRAVPVGTQDTVCQLVCLQSKCSQQSLPDGAVDCVAGRCVAGFNCDTAKVTCLTLPPACVAGEVPGVNALGSCYAGGCVPATQCKRVSSCAVCSSAQACVANATQMGSQIHCVTVPTTCSGSAASCSCLGASSCVAPYTSCSPLSGVKGVSCDCPNC